MAQHQAATVTAAARSAPMPVLKSCYAKGTAISMETGTEKPANPCADSRLLSYRVAAFFVFAEASGHKGLPTDVVD